MAALLIKTNTDPSFINLSLEELIIDSLEEVVQGFAETSDIELVGQKLEEFEKNIDSRFFLE